MESLTGATVEVTEDMFPSGTWENNGTILTVAPLWVMKDTVSFEDYKPSIQKNFRKYARIYGCKRTVSDEALIKCPEVLDLRATKRPHPFNPDGTINTNILKADADADYFIHFDLATKHDAVGISMCHWCDKREKVVVDFMLRRVPPKNDELRISRQRQIVYDLEKLGFDFYKVTFDGWQSLEGIQSLKDHGISAETYSVDRTTAAYDTMIDLINEDMLDYYPHQIFLDELKGIRIFGKKYDHSPAGINSKDVVDSVAGCVFQCNMRRPKTANEEEKQSENDSAE